MEFSGDMAGVTRSEEQVSQKYDKCLADAVVKFGGGLAVGMVFSVVLFKRRMWPAIFGAGLGTGIAYGNCQNSLNEPFLVPAQRVRVADPAALRSVRLRPQKVTGPLVSGDGPIIGSNWTPPEREVPVALTQAQSAAMPQSSPQAMYEAAQAYYQAQPVSYDSQPTQETSSWNGPYQ
ncbi:unnamed protein product [Notodromas monacha]|uniref:MICOS complex subunit MIC10 n=1 Tax=Notodromas monacha TaxID=399045 RepID=A0A7R9BMY6_9CRUS|nr:unnamed protein product [Notodromas monacha]CAG0918465.1 unnamed protein product [Notodromas monacha]